MIGVYKAERAVFGDRFQGRDAGVALADARGLVDRYVDGWTVERTRGDGTAGSWCYTESKRIALARHAGLPIVLHELAHALAAGRGHGLAFQVVYLDLVEKEMGSWWARRLRAALIRCKTKGHKTLKAMQ